MAASLAVRVTLICVVPAARTVLGSGWTLEEVGAVGGGLHGPRVREGGSPGQQRIRSTPNVDGIRIDRMSDAVGKGRGRKREPMEHDVAAVGGRIRTVCISDHTSDKGSVPFRPSA